MTETDNIFFEEFKKLNNLCSDMYSCRDGLRAYQSDMDKKVALAVDRSEWARTYHKIKHICYIRNILAHENHSTPVSTLEDIAFTTDLYDKILQRQDPISLAVTNSRRQSSPVQTRTIENTFDNTSSECAEHTHSEPHIEEQDQYNEYSAAELIFLLLFGLFCFLFFLIHFIRIL